MAHRLVNLWQTPEERQAKYHLARSLGVNYAWARVMRDWPLAKIERRFNLYFDETHNHAPVMKPYAQFLLPNFPRMLWRAENPLSNL